ncbi:MAG: hypothetical protein AAF184_05705 [Pseudomonadota bacterium]
MLATVLATLYLASPGPLSAQTYDPVVLPGNEAGIVDDVTLRVTVPQGANDAPVIVWSHAYGGSRQAYQPLVSHWASWGYAVVQIDHSDSYLQQDELPDDGCTQLFDFSNWDERAYQVRYVLNRLDTIEALTDASFDDQRVAIGGHSMGALTMQLIAGAAPFDGRDFTDAKPVAAMLLSAVGTNIGLFDEQSHLGVTLPLMVMTGTEDGEDDFPWYERTDPYFLAGSSLKYLPILVGGDHAFGGILGDLPVPTCELADDPRQLDITRSATMMFLDAHVRESPVARAYARGDALPREAPGEVIYLWQ